MAIKISIIIPALNEENNLPNLFSNLKKFNDVIHEIIIVDGGSKDNTLLYAYEGADQVVISKPGRAMQMNIGASVASGDVLLFLHCDTYLPVDTFQLITKKYCSERYWGRFDVRLSGERMIFRLIETMMNFRSRYTAIATGDQAMFIGQTLFNQVGGFPEIALMEDIAISKQLKKIVSPVCFTQVVVTSSRRWEQRGVFKTVLLMWRLRLLFYFGVSPEKLSRSYR